MNLGLTDKVIVVTGGAKGIGAGIVKVLAAEGAIPIIIGRSEADNMVVVREVETAGGKALPSPQPAKKQLQQFCNILDG
jgi:L-fucose dehydrogenase